MHYPSPKTERPDFINKFITIGDEVEAVIVEIDPVEHKLELSIRQITLDPWLKASAKYIVNSKHSGTVTRISKFGVIVIFEEFVEGYVHISELSWNLKFKHPSEILNIGDTLEVVVLDKNPEKRKLSLSYKQTIPNPWDQFEIKYAVGTVHFNKIYEIVEKGATIKLQENCIAFIQKSDLKKLDGSILQKNEHTNFTITEFEKEHNRIIVSVAQ